MIFPGRVGSSPIAALKFRQPFDRTDGTANSAPKISHMKPDRMRAIENNR